uniref:Pentatricopeptide repeat-containing protein n=1 Tax=Hordeum vulgare subsp. vulgare TaxID=112509 RepID=A0A8I6XPH8_HORVV
MEEAKRLHARLLWCGICRLQPLLLRVLAADDHRYAALLLVSSPRSATLHDRLLHALASSRSVLLILSFSRAHRLRLLTPLSFIFLLSSPLLLRALRTPRPRPARQVRPLCVGDTAVCNALLSAYARAGLLDAVEKLFREMLDRNVVSWTAMVSGYEQNGRHEEAVGAFLEMWKGAGVQPNELMVSSVLPACAAVGAMELGVKVEEYARGKGHLRNVFVTNALLEMYAKCGSIQRAWQVFQGIGGAEIAKGNARGTAGGTKLYNRLIRLGTRPGKGKLPNDEGTTSEHKTTQPTHLARDCAGRPKRSFKNH